MRVSATVPEGYKQTEVGVIPEDWNVRKQGDIVEFINGRAYHRHEWETSGVPVCRLQNLTGSGDSFYYSNLKLPEKQYMEFGDLIFMWSASFGPYIWKGPRAIFHYHIWKIECNQKYVDKSFFYHALVDMTERLKSKTSGSTMLHLTKEGMEKYPLALPKFSEQKSIAKVLTDSDFQIQALENQISKKRDIKQSTMQELLTGKTRLAGFSDEWVVRRLGDFAVIIMGQSPSSSSYNTSGIGLPLIQGNADVENRMTIIRNYTSQITKEAKKGDIIMSVRAPVGEIASTNFDACIGRGVCAIKYPNNYLFHLLIFSESIWTKFSGGSTFESINSNEIQNATFLIPPTKNEQVAIASILSDMDAEIAALEERLEKAKAIKQGMMQQLLTGKIRLVD